MIPLLVLAAVGFASYLTVKRIAAWPRWPSVSALLTAVGKEVHADLRTTRHDLLHWRKRQRFRRELG